MTRTKRTGQKELRRRHESGRKIGGGGRGGGRAAKRGKRHGNTYRVSGSSCRGRSCRVNAGAWVHPSPPLSSLARSPLPLLPLSVSRRTPKAPLRLVPAWTPSRQHTRREGERALSPLSIYLSRRRLTVAANHLLPIIFSAFPPHLRPLVSR